MMIIGQIIGSGKLEFDRESGADGIEIGAHVSPIAEATMTLD